MNKLSGEWDRRPASSPCLFALCEWTNEACSRMTSHPNSPWTTWNEASFRLFSFLSYPHQEACSQPQIANFDQGGVLNHTNLNPDFWDPQIVCFGKGLENSTFPCKFTRPTIFFCVTKHSIVKVNCENEYSSNYNSLHSICKIITRIIDIIVTSWDNFLCMTFLFTGTNFERK